MVEETEKSGMLSPYCEHKQCSCGVQTLLRVKTVLPTGFVIISPICNACCKMVERGVKNNIKHGKNCDKEK